MVMISWSQNSQLHHYLQNLLGAELKAFMETPPPVPAIRHNELKTDRESFEKFLNRVGQQYDRIQFTTSGYILGEDHLPLSHTLNFFLGYFQYQGQSSQLPVILLDVQPGERVLDMTAAPGSKSTQLAAVMKNQGELILNDATLSRHQPLNVNMQRSGAVNYYVLHTWGERMGSIFPEYFDKILLDAPCSALGTINSHPSIGEWWNIDKLMKLSRVQYQLLISAFKALKVGGELVYSTCSLAPEENEMVIDRLMKEYPLQIVNPPDALSRLFDKGWTEYKSEKFDPSLSAAIRIWPQRQQMEGFFAVKLRKLAAIRNVKNPSRVNFISTFPANDPAIMAITADLERNWGLSNTLWQNFRFLMTRTRLWLVNQTVRQVLQPRFVSAGLLLAEKRLFGWKLLNGSAQVFSDYISSRRIKADTSLLKTLFARGRISLPGLADGYYALDYDNKVLACVYCEQGEIRINLPHYFSLII
jgi:16S rRNA (cytosine1407-C5)-methyltransferase